MQLRKLTRFFKASALLMLAVMAVATLVPPARAQEQINFNARFLNLPGGLGNTLGAGGTGANALFPIAGNGLGSNAVSDVVVYEANGDGFQDIAVGSLNSDEVAVFLGRGNGSFVRANLGTVNDGNTFFAQTGTPTYSDAVVFGATDAVIASTGRVTSMAAVANFSGLGFSRLAVALDYNAATYGTGISAQLLPFADQILYLDIDANGDVLNNSGFACNGTRGFAPLTGQITVAGFNANPVSVCVGSLDAGGLPDVGYMCSGAYDNFNGDNDPGVSGGFVAIDRGADADSVFGNVVDGFPTPEQVIGGGTDPAQPVVLEVNDPNDPTGSLYDARQNVGQANTNLYNFGANQANRRRFRVTPNSEVLAGIQPRGCTFGNTAHRDDGANDLAFVAVDFGSANVGNRIGGVVVPAQARPSEGAVFVLTNNQFTNGFLLRNARRLDERYDYRNTPVTQDGQQDGVILRAGNVPTGVAAADFNGDNRLDLAASNSGGGTVSIYQSAMVNDNNITNPFVGQQITSYQNPIFVQVGGSPNSVYTRDLNNDGRPDITGTNLASAGGYAVFNNANAAGTFTNGAVVFSPSTVSPGASRALAFATTPFNGLSGGIEFGNNPVANQPDAVFARTSTAGGVGVRYGISSAATSVTLGQVILSSFVGVAEGRLNGDTLPDVAIVDRGADRAIVVLNAAAGFASSSTTTTFIDLGDLFPNIEAGGLSGGDIGDVDKNGSTDIVLSVDGPNDQAIVLYNIGGLSDIDARFTIRAFPIGGDPTAIRLADLAGPAGPGQGGATARDGAPEIIAVNRRSNTVTTLINNGIGIFGQGRVAETGGFDPLSQAIADFNDDGKLDTAVLNRGRRGAIADPNQSDDSIVSILFGNGDGSFQATNFLIPVARGSVSIAAAGYGVVRQAVQIDTPDLNLDGMTDLAVASQLGGGPSDDIINPFTGNNEAGALTVLFGSTTVPGQFTRSEAPQRLIDTLGSGGRIGIYPGSFDVRDGRVIGYGVLALNGDYNQNGRPDAHVGGAEANNGAVGSNTAPTGFVLQNGFAASITSLDNLSTSFGAERTFNVFPSITNDSNTVSARIPVDVDNVTGVVSASSYVVSATGTIVGQDVNDFNGGFGQIVPDTVQVTAIGRAYITINVASVLNHAPLVTTSRGLADFSGPGRKVVMNEGEEVKITLRAGDIDPSAPGAIRYRLVQFPNFVSMVDNNNGTATVTIKPSLTDGAASANNGLGQRYDFQAEATDNDFRLPLTSSVFFRIFVKDKPTAPSVAAIADQRMYTGQSLTIPVKASGADRLSTTFSAPFATFTDFGGGNGAFSLRPDVSLATAKYNISVSAFNNAGLSASTSFNLEVIQNGTPRIEGAFGNVELDADSAQVLSFRVLDSDVLNYGQKIQMSLVNAPGFVSLTQVDNEQGSLRIAPSAADKGTYIFTLAVEDDGSPKRSATVTVNLKVNPVVNIASAVYQQKRLIINGTGFGSAPQLKVNGVTVAAGLIQSVGDTNITAKGNKKSLGLRNGGNTIQVIGVDGRASNTYTFALANGD